MPVQEQVLQDGTRWIDITQPTLLELDEIAMQFGIQPRMLQDSLDPEHLPKFEQLPNATFLIVRFYYRSHTHVDTIQAMTTKIALFYARDFLITIHKNESTCLQKIATEKAYHIPDNIANLVTVIVADAIQSFEQPAIRLSMQIDSYEKTVLLKNTKTSLLTGLYYLKRQASACKKVLLLSSDLIHFIDTKHADSLLIQDVRDEHLKLLTLYDTVLDDVSNLLATYLSLAAQRTNEVMKVLTVFSVFFMPLTFIVGVYGMNFHFMPELTWRWGYPAVWGIMVSVTIATLFWMRKKRLI